MRIAVINGPNLNLLGVREPEKYGRESLTDIEGSLRTVARELNVDIDFFQKNGEGELLDLLHSLRGKVQGAVINAGAYSHSSLALRDALVGVSIPFVELHITNVYGREPERRHSMLAPAALGVICGLGTYGYELALRGLVKSLASRA
jgi:3-dehydroquinate dehydratase-2